MRYHQNHQSDKLTIFDLMMYIDLLQYNLEQLKKARFLEGGFEKQHDNSKRKRSLQWN